MKKGGERNRCRVESTMKQEPKQKQKTAGHPSCPRRGYVLPKRSTTGQDAMLGAWRKSCIVETSAGESRTRPLFGASRRLFSSRLSAGSALWRRGQDLWGILLGAYPFYLNHNRAVAKRRRWADLVHLHAHRQYM